MAQSPGEHTHIKIVEARPEPSLGVRILRNCPVEILIAQIHLGFRRPFALAVAEVWRQLLWRSAADARRGSHLCQLAALRNPSFTHAKKTWNLGK